MSNDTSNHWIQYYRNVAEMRLNIEVITDDLNYDGRILYAVDNDVVIFFADPIGNKQYADEEGGVFYNDKNGSKELEGLAISLGEFIFLNGLVSNDKNSCLLFPTPMAKEFLGKYDKILFGARIEQDNVTGPRIKQENVTEDQQMIEELTEVVDNCKKIGSKSAKKELVTRLINEYENLVRYLSPYDYSTNIGKLQRFAIIGKKERLRNIETIKGLFIPSKSEIIKSEEHKKWDEWFRKKLKKIEDKKQIAQKTDKDSNEDVTKGNQNNKNENEKRDEKNIVNDINTLSLISILNKSFKQKNKKIKILYITGDGAAKAISNSKAISKEAVTLNIEYDFLRYPKQFVPLVRFDNKSIVNRDDKLKQLILIKEPVDEFLSLFSIDGDYLKNLKEVVKRNEDSDNYIRKVVDPYRNELFTEKRYRELQDNIKKLTSSLAVINKRDISYMASSLAEALWNDEDLYKQLQDTQENAFCGVTDTLKTFGTLDKITKQFEKLIGYHESLSLTEIEKDGIARGPVSLRRSPERGGDDFFEEIHDLVYGKQWALLYEKIEKSSLYIHYLAIALVAADANEWKEARKNCDVALELEKEGKTNEGYYFLAVTLRHSCEDFNDYIKAKDSLNEFKRIWEARYNEARQDHRFESERLALATAYFNYERFYKDWCKNERDADKPKLRKTWDDLATLAQEIKIKDEEHNEPKIVCHRIKRQIYSNQCCLFLIDRYVNKKEEIKESEGVLAYDLLLVLSKTVDFRSSYFINFLIAFMAWHINNEEKLIWKKALENTEIAFEKRKIPYESQKYTYFKEILTTYGRNKIWV